LIIAEALERGINLIAITDHNASANIEAVMLAGRQVDITVLPGMEVQTREEVHVLCLFDTLKQIAAWQKIVDDHLPALQNDPEHFGSQFVVDQTGDFIREEPRLLLCSTSLSLDKTVQQVHDLGGLAIPAHVNRKAFGLIENLGFIPPDIAFDAIEVSKHTTPEAFVSSQRLPVKLPIIQSGDVHRLDEFLGKVELNIESRKICEIRKAFYYEDGRKFQIITRN